MSEIIEEPNGIPAGSGGINFRPILRTVQRKFLLIAGVAGLALTAAAWHVRENSIPYYEGTFQILVEPPTSEAQISDPSTLAGGRGLSRDAGIDYETQLRILSSPSMLSSILEQIQQRYPGVTEHNLRNNLFVERVGGNRDGTRIIQVYYRGVNPELVELVLEITAQEYLDYSLDQRRTYIGQGVQFIDNQLPELQERVSTLQSRLQQMQQQYRLINPQSQGEQIYSQSQQVETQQQELQRELNELVNLYQNLQQQLGISVEDAIDELTLRQEPSFQSLLNRTKEVDVQIAEESARFQPGSPSLDVLLDRRESLLALLNQETQRIIGKPLNLNVHFQVQNTQNSLREEQLRQYIDTGDQIEILARRNEAIAQDRALVEQQVNQFPELQRQYNELQRQLTLATQTLDQLLTQRETLRVQSAQNRIPWELIAQPELKRDEAGLPLASPIEYRRILMQAGLIGLAIGLAIALLIEKVRNIFYTPEEIKDTTKLPLLGVIPRYKKRDRFSDTGTLVDLFDQEVNKNSLMFQTAFDGLYENIRFLFSETPLRSVAVCSTESGDGKTTVAAYLAQTAALMGQRVLLVDANFHYPQVYLNFELSSKKGLSNLLTDTSLLPENVIQSSNTVDCFCILPAGDSQENSSRLLASEKMSQLMKDFEERFDLVIYDTPQLKNTISSNFLAAHTDGIIMVVSVQKTARSLVEEKIKQLTGFQIPILGIVANHNANPNTLESIRLYDFSEVDYPKLSEYQNEIEVRAESSPEISTKSQLMENSEYIIKKTLD